MDRRKFVKQVFGASLALGGFMKAQRALGGLNTFTLPGKYMPGKTSKLWLDEIDLGRYAHGVHSKYVATPGSGKIVRIGNKRFKRGVGVRGTSVIPFLMNGKAESFSGFVGYDYYGKGGNEAKFFVLGDGRILFESGEMKAGDPPQRFNVDLKNVKRVGLLVLRKGAGDEVVKVFWADAAFTIRDGYLPLEFPNDAPKYILTPPPDKKPRINSARVFGAKPGNPFLYAVAATGERPMRFSEENLPSGLVLDEKTGIITGKTPAKGEYKVRVKAENRFGEAVQELVIKAGDSLALTPPMGWNGWNAWQGDMRGKHVMDSIDAMLSTGLINHGWTYINVDDMWEGPRGGKFNAIQPDANFADLPELIEKAHSNGMKFGVYSTPWITTYQGYTGGSSDYEDGKFPEFLRKNRGAYHYVGRYKFEVNDAKQMAEWGIDYLKYDWHMASPAVAEPMSSALRESGRDIVFSLSNGAPIEYAEEWGELANLYRTGSDIRDSWISIYSSAFSLDDWAPYGGPGHWNDPDMLVVGNIACGMAIHPTRLTPDEQYTHISMWSLLAAPLIIGCPLEQADQFTLGLLSNDEVLEIDQDPLGKPATCAFRGDTVQIFSRPLADGSFAVGLFNVADFGKTPQSYFRWGDEKPIDYEFHLKSVGLSGEWRVRDVWRQKVLSSKKNSLNVHIPYHGVVLLRIFPLEV